MKFYNSKTVNAIIMFQLVPWRRQYEKCGEIVDFYSHLATTAPQPHSRKKEKIGSYSYICI